MEFACESDPHPNVSRQDAMHLPSSVYIGDVEEPTVCFLV
jgi:hypothetical protein